MRKRRSETRRKGRTEGGIKRIMEGGREDEWREKQMD